MAAAAGSSAGRGIKGSWVTLVSSDGQRFQLPEAAATSLSVMLRETLEIGQGRGPVGIPLHRITGQTLSMVVAYCNRHYDADAAAGNGTDDGEGTKAAKAARLREWDERFIDLRQDKLYDVLVAANYLRIDGLVDLACWRFADMIKGKSASDIRVMLGIGDDFTPEQRAEILKESPWVWSEQSS